MARDGAQIAMAGFGGMDEIGGRAGGGQSGGDLAGDMARFAHAADDDPALCRQHHIDGADEFAVQRGGQAPRASAA